MMRGEWDADVDVDVDVDVPAWWSYRSSLSKKSIASEDTRCWLSALTNLDLGIGGARSEQRHATTKRISTHKERALGYVGHIKR